MALYDVDDFLLLVPLVVSTHNIKSDRQVIISTS